MIKRYSLAMLESNISKQPLVNLFTLLIFTDSRLRVFNFYIVSSSFGFWVGLPILAGSFG